MPEPIFRAHTIRTANAARLWRQYRQTVTQTDTRGSLRSKIPELPAWKIGVLIAIREQMLSTKLPESEAFQILFGESLEDSFPKKPLVTYQDDGSVEVNHTTEDINQPIMSLEDLILISKLDVQKHEVRDHKVNTWSTVTKNTAGEPVVTRLWQVSATFQPRTLPLVPLDWGAPPPYTPRVTEPLRGGFKQAVILPDMQIGFQWQGLSEGKPWAAPFHDRRAIDIALQILGQAQPDTVVLLGDNLDFQPLSTRWPVPPEGNQTTAIALLEWRWLLYQIRGLCPSSRIVYMLGNHEARLEKFLNERAGELKGLTHFDGRKALSLSSILGLEDLHVEVVDYPQAYWLWDRVEIEHGRVVRQGGGATAARIAANREHSVLYGHVHRQEVAHRTIETPKGKREVVVGSPGCLCRVDGFVPGSDRPDWQQGVGILSLVDAPGMDEHLDLVRIQKGQAVVGASLLTGRDYVHELVKATGATALLPR